MKYEYKVEIVKVPRLITALESKTQEKQLNAVGEYGWKLISVAPGKKYMKYIYIREKA